MISCLFLVMRLLGLHFDNFTVLYGSCMPSFPKESISPWLHNVHAEYKRRASSPVNHVCMQSDLVQLLNIGCAEGDVRPLIGGSMATEGYMEVCVGGRFLAVSLDTFSVAEANVLCRQLNLGSG